MDKNDVLAEEIRKLACTKTGMKLITFRAKTWKNASSMLITVKKEAAKYFSEDQEVIVNMRPLGEVIVDENGNLWHEKNLPQLRHDDIKFTSFDTEYDAGVASCLIRNAIRKNIKEENNKKEGL